MANDKIAMPRTIDTDLFQAFRNYVRHCQQRDVADPLDFEDATPEAKAMWADVERRLRDIRAAIGEYKAAQDIVERADVKVAEGFVCPNMKVQALSPELFPDYSWAMQNLQAFFSVWDHKENAWAVWLRADPKAVTVHDLLVGDHHRATAYEWLRVKGMKEVFRTFDRMPLPKREETRGRCPTCLDRALPFECFEDCEGVPAEAADDDISDEETDAERVERHLPFRERVEAQIKKLGKTSMTVLFTGETGAGKEHWAKELRRTYSNAKGGDVPFLPVNCGAIQPELFASEVFGAAKGAYTDRKSDKRGFIDGADGGILFLDEIGEVPLDCQVQLLRLIERKEYQRVGDPDIRKANVRIVAATNRDLQEDIGQGRFRQDLYARLSPFIIRILPLRVRRDEIAQLAYSRFKSIRAELVAEGLEVKTKRFPEKERCKLAQIDYEWPENVRQLGNAIRRAIADGKARAPLTADEVMGAARQMASKSDDQ